MELKWFPLVIRGFSEFSATAFFMMISSVSYVFADQITNMSVISSIVTGLAVVTTMHIFGCISSAHTNPCVSIACYLLDYIRFNRMILYVTCQLAGCAFGYFLLLQMLPHSMIDTAEPGFRIIDPMQDLSFIVIIGIEAFLTASLIFAWCALWDVRSGRSLDSVALRMGCQIAVCSLIGFKGSLTGAFMNPAKLLISTLFEGKPQSAILQLIGELLAAIIVPQLWKLAAYRTEYNPLHLNTYII